MTGPPVAARPGTRRRRREEAWQPVLLRMPDTAGLRSADWQPALIRPIRLTTTVLLAAFLALQFLIPARLVIGGMGAVGRPSVAVGVLLMFLWFVSFVRSRQLPEAVQPIRWVVFGFLAIQLFGYAVGYDRLLPGVEASSADRWLIFVVAMSGVTLAVCDGVPGRQQFDRLLRLLVGLTTVMAGIGILQFLGVADLTRYMRLPGLHNNADLIGIGERGGPGFARVASTATHFIEFGVVLSMVLPLAIHYGLFARTTRGRWWAWTACGLIGAAIPFSLSRSATIAVGMGLFLLATVWPWRQRYNAGVIAVIATAAFTVIQPGVLGTIRALFVHVDNDPSIQNRLADTEYVMKLWGQRPWIGRGAGTVIPERYILLDNQLYMTLLAGGVVGLVGLVLFFVIPYFVARSIRLRGADQETRHLAQALAVIFPVGLVASATFDSFSFATFVGLTFFAVGAVGALWRLDHESGHERVLQVAAPGDRFVASPLMAPSPRAGGAANVRTVAGRTRPVADGGSDQLPGVTSGTCVRPD